LEYLGEGGEGRAKGKHQWQSIFYFGEGSMSRFLCWGSAPPPPTPIFQKYWWWAYQMAPCGKRQTHPFPPPPLEWGYFFMLQKKGIIWMIDEIYCNFHTNMDDG